MKAKLSKQIREYMASLGRKGGKATGVKGFNREQARAAAMARWNKVKKQK
jgi:general stress protein YciG